MSVLDSKKNDNDNKNSKTKNLETNSKSSSIIPNEKLETKKKNNDIDFDNISLNRFIIFLFEILEMKLK